MCPWGPPDATELRAAAKDRQHRRRQGISGREICVFACSQITSQRMTNRWTRCATLHPVIHLSSRLATKVPQLIQKVEREQRRAQAKLKASAEVLTAGKFESHGTWIHLFGDGNFQAFGAYAAVNG